MNIDYQEYLDQIAQAKADYSAMAAEEMNERRESYYRGILQGLEEACSLLAEIIDGSLTV